MPSASKILAQVILAIEIKNQSVWSWILLSVRTPGWQVGEFCLTITSGTEFQPPKNTPSPLNVTHYCCSSFGSMPIRHGNQPFYCHFFPESITWGLRVNRFYWGYKTLNGLTSPQGLAPGLPLCFLRFLIPSSHLLYFIWQSSLALLPSWLWG